MKNIIDGLMIILFILGASAIDSPNFMVPVILLFFPMLWIIINLFMERRFNE